MKRQSEKTATLLEIINNHQRGDFLGSKTATDELLNNRELRENEMERGRRIRELLKRKVLRESKGTNIKATRSDIKVQPNPKPSKHESIKGVICKPTISLVTSVYNRFWQLRETLPSNLRELSHREDTELVVVDFGGSDSVDIYNFIESKFQLELSRGLLRYFTLASPWDRFHMARAKNTALLQARGDFIFSLDADNFVKSEDLNSFTEILQLHRDGVIVHQTTNKQSPILNNLWKDYLPMPDREHQLPEATTIKWDGSSGRIGCSKDLIHALGGYNENLTLMGMEDIDFLLRVKRLGARYIHQSLLHRKEEDIFIDQGSKDSEHEHNNNKRNWEVMRERIHHFALSDTSFRADPEKVHCNESAIKRYTSRFKTTLFSVQFKSDRWIERFSRQCSEIASKCSDTCIIIVQIQDYVAKETSRLIQELCSKHDNVLTVHFSGDIGLYNTWNTIIHNISSEYCGNLNPDDFRTYEHHRKAVLMLDQGRVDIAYPWTVPSPDTNELEEEIISQKNRIWFRDLPIVSRDDTRYPIFKTLFCQDLQDVTSTEHFFQILPSGIPTSYTIPNASALWKRDLHDKSGYFDEDKYGRFADLEFWCKCVSNGATMQCTEEYALFYDGDSQAHKSQSTRDSTIISLALQYGSASIRSASLCAAFDMRIAGGTYGSHHYLGWDHVRDSLEAHFIHNDNGLLLDMFVERTFYWGGDITYQRLLEKEWLGFIHTTPHKSEYYSEDASNLLSLINDKRFHEALKTCRGLITLSHANSESLEALIGGTWTRVPVFTLFHPVIPVKNSANPIPDERYKPRVFHIGVHLRNFKSFYSLNIDSSRKNILVPPGNDSTAFISNKIMPQLASTKISAEDLASYTNKIFSASQEEYEYILANDIIYNDYIEPAGSNLISEAVSAHSLLVINRHSAFEEILGHKYPLFYTTQQEAEALISRLFDSHQYRSQCRTYMSQLKNQHGIDSFAEGLKKIAYKVYRNLNG